ncbi:hypothetical protein LTR53_001257 [Teratosphaeriaceae sp. CCFEE 6253]|nr:hypothetical protein LTR53_001257 [Teratosphaeriaceae sp. CCFEE 6253]
MKTVCIVGAGPAGLVAARTFLRTGHLIVTVYEKHHRIGGIWALDETTKDGYLDPKTPTNLSRFTVGFGDLDWRDVDLRSSQSNGTASHGERSGHVPTFPKAWQVNRYLEEYRARYIPDGVIILSTKVTGACRCEDGGRWKVETEHSDGGSSTGLFDYLIVASGFFATPRWPKQEDQGEVSDMAAVRTLHSSQFRTLADSISSVADSRGQTVLVVGAGNSAGETAAAVAMQLSDAAWSPDTSRQKRYKTYDVVHVTPRPIQSLPPYLEYEKGSKTYVPIDFKLYDFSRRPAGLESYAGQVSPAVRDATHNALQDMIGGDQSDLGSEALICPPKSSDRGTANAALSESYAEFVRSGLIDVKAGRVTGIEHLADGTATATVSHGDERTIVNNLGAVIYATGYTPSTALDFLANDVKQALQYDPCSTRLPLILEQWQTMNGEVPNAAFIGFYEGPYWPMMEMQARLTAQRWVETVSTAAQRPYEDRATLVQLRKDMQGKALGVPQYWFGDYLGYMEDIAGHLNLDHEYALFGIREGCPSPARYLSTETDRPLAKATMSDLHTVWQDCIDNGRFVARAVLRAMHGDWDISRRIVSKDPAFSGTLEGQASLHPRFPTKDRSKKHFDLEHLYIESGTFTSASGMKMLARRRYVYRYCEADDRLSVWFVKPDNDLEVDYLFHDLSFVPPAEARKAGACIAKADHLCVDDMYWTQYTLPMEAIALRKFEVRHTVKGPQKDYVATTQYTRSPKRRASP